MSYPEVKRLEISKLKNPDKYIGRIEYIDIRSSLEYSFIKYLDESKYVIGWNSEEVIIYYFFQNRKHRYYVDFFVKIKDKNNKIRNYLVEIKPKIETLSKPVITENMSEKTKAKVIETFAKNQAKWKAARSFCEKNNFIFKIVTEEDLK